jgi:hypothetical protein
LLKAGGRRVGVIEHTFDKAYRLFAPKLL